MINDKCNEKREKFCESEEIEMREAYEKPEVKVVMFDKDDIVTMTLASGPDFEDGGHYGRE
ncbi:MAG: hypothetical protein PHR92_08085 [Lachnospiraceae bacterium]|nr:hypothetical protein [Lachnospiraceae bacterium]